MDVTILLGSKSDMPVAEKCTKILEQFDVYRTIGRFIVSDQQACPFRRTGGQELLSMADIIGP